MIDEAYSQVFNRNLCSLMAILCWKIEVFVYTKLEPLD